MKIVRALSLPLIAILLVISLAQPTQANLIGYKFFLEDTNGDAVFTGELFIDETLSDPETFYAFGDISGASMPGSLSFIIDGILFDLFDANSLASLGILTDSTGAVTTFYANSLAEEEEIGFASFQGKDSGFGHFTENNLAWVFTVTFDDPASMTEYSGPTHAFTRIPEPSSSLLFGIGLLGLVRLWRRRIHANAG